MYIPDNISQKLELHLILQSLNCYFFTTKGEFQNYNKYSPKQYKTQSDNVRYYIEHIKENYNIAEYVLTDIDEIIDSINTTKLPNIYELFILKNAFDFIYVLLKEKRFFERISFSFEKDLINDIRKLLSGIVDEKGELKNSASKKLSNIIYELDKLKERELQLIKRVIDKYKDKLMNDNITLFDNRMVVQVKTTCKNEINGILHDYSNTEKTAFMEPNEFIDYNNKLRSLYIEKNEEIKNILIKVKEILKKHFDILESVKQVLIIIDRYNAIADFMLKYNAKYPTIGNKFVLKNAYNPILYKIKQEKTIPFDLVLDKEKSLLITGPNMGGKTVLLKTLGLFQLMLHKGLPLTLSQDSIIPFFDNIFVDIGDDQSVELGVSTFASHLINYKNIIDNVDEKTMVLLDEIGTGTNVKEGSAFAIGLIHYLIEKKAMIVFTSHFDNIKDYAANNEYIEYASMSYDINSNKPSYKLIMNSMGISGVINLVKQYRFPIKIIKTMQRLLGKKYGDYNKLIEQYKDKIIDIEKKEKIISQQLKTIEKLKEYYEKYNKKYKELTKILEKKYSEKLENELKSIRRESELFIKAIKESKADKSSIKNLKDFIDKNLEKYQYKEKKENKTFDIKENDLVLLDNNIKGIVKEIRGKRIIVDINGISLETNINSIVNIENEKENKKRRVIFNGDIDINYSIDLRGKYVEDAIMELEVYIQNAIASGLKQIKIIHGHGTGALKGAIREYLKQLNNIRFESGDSFQGGDGVTIVYFF